MRVLLDTQVWIWMRNAPTRLSAKARRILASPDTELLLSAATPWEMAIKVAIGKLELPCPVDEFVRSRSEATQVTSLPITQRHGIVSAQLPWHHRDPFDRVLVAQAQLERIPLMTNDEALRPYDVKVLWAI